MLARPYRLPATFRLSHPKTLHSPLFLLKYAPSSVSHSRCSVIISKAVDKRATKRNELRRIIVTTLHGRLKENKKPYDLLFIVKKESVNVLNAQLEAQVIESFEKVIML